MTCEKCNDSGTISSHGAFGEPESYQCPECECAKKYSFNASGALTIEVLKTMGFFRKFYDSPDNGPYQIFTNINLKHVEVNFKREGAFVQMETCRPIKPILIKTPNDFFQALIMFGTQMGRDEKSKEIKTALGI